MARSTRSPRRRPAPGSPVRFLARATSSSNAPRTRRTCRTLKRWPARSDALYMADERGRPPLAQPPPQEGGHPEGPLPNPLPQAGEGANAMPKSTDELDFVEVRRSFDHAAASYDAHAVLQREVCDRLLERLGYMSVQPGRV